MLNIATIDAQAWADMCERARRYSLRHEATIYINARVCVVESASGAPRVEVTFYIGGWYSSDSTVAQYTSGNRVE